MSLTILNNHSSMTLMRILPNTLLSLAVLTIASSEAHANSRPLFNIDLPAQALAQTLQQLATIGHVKLVYSDQAVQSLNSVAIKGRYSLTQALHKALQQNPLHYQVIDHTLIVITANTPPPPVSSKPVLPSTQHHKPQTPAPDKPAAAEQLETMTVYGVMDEEPSYITYKTTSATRTDTPIMQIPQSVQIVTRKLIDDQQNVVVSESLRNVSGVVTNNVLFTPSAEKTRIRGFAAEQLLDGFTQYYNPGDRESTINLERIEVLKGSNAVLYSGGSGAPVGGVVNLASKLPQSKAFTQLGMKLGSYDFYQPFVDINQPITNNILLRITGEFTDAHSYIDSIHTERFNINPALTFTDQQRTSLTLQGRLSRWRQQDYQGLPATGTLLTNKFTLKPELFLGPSNLPPSISDFDGIWGTLDHKLNDTWSINVKARYAESIFDQKAQTIVGSDGYIADKALDASNPKVGTRWAVSNAELLQEQEEKSVLGNVLAKFKLGSSKHKVLFGADYSQYSDSGFISGGYGSGINLLDLSKPQFLTPYTTPFNAGNIQFVTNTTYGGYLQWQSDWYDRLHLLFSLRAGVAEIDYRNLAQQVSAATDTTKFLPRVGAVFDLNHELAVFVNYSEGMRGQPFVNFVGPPKPALSSSFEGGIKFDFTELSGQIAAYQIDRTNVAVSDWTDPNFRSITAGEQQSHGFEADLVWQPIIGLNILNNYTYTHAAYTNDINSEFISSLASVPEGSKLPGVPEHTARVWANYDFQQAAFKGLSIGAGVYWQSSTYLSNQNFFKSDSFYNLDASIAYQFQRYKLAATIKNLTDEDYFQYFGYFGGRVVPAQPVSAYVTLTIDF